LRGKESKVTVKSLQDLTGRESGIIMFGKKGVLCNWADIEGFPRLCGRQVVGTSERIPFVLGIHMKSLFPLFRDVMIGNFTLQDFEYIRGGIVYKLNDDIIVVIPDGWVL
jgi:hypothetical protein